MQVVGKIIIKTTKTTVRMLFEGRRVNFLEAVVRILEVSPHLPVQGHTSVGSKAALVRRHEGEQHVWGRTGLSSEQKEKIWSRSIRYKAVPAVPLTSQRPWRDGEKYRTEVCSALGGLFTGD